MDIKMTLTRTETGAEGTFGRIVVNGVESGDISSFTTAELPWKETGRMFHAFLSACIIA